MGLQRALTFAEIDSEIDAYVEVTARSQPGAVERWSFALGLFSGGIGSLLATLMGGALGLRIVQFALAIECASFLVWLGSFLVRERRTFFRVRRHFAEELDGDYVRYRECITWLDAFPDNDVGCRLRYVRDRKSTMSYRLGLFTGGIERLGILPLLAALYLQFRGWQFGDWSALDQVNLLGGLLLWALLLGYAASWYVIGLKNRLDAYDFVLSERLHSTQKRTPP